MPRDKDLKRLVRARMEKTGEAYTAARAQIINKREQVAPDADHGAIAGMSDAAVSAKTGRTWRKWVGALDAAGAARLSHAEIARLVNATFEVGPWWAQMVTVGYERIKGLRARGQRRDGSYEATKSRTFAVDVETLFDAWADARIRRKWLDRTGLRVRAATAPKSIRLDWPEGGIIAVGFTAKGKGKSSVALSHDNLPDRESANQVKQYWSERLDSLARFLER